MDSHGSSGNPSVLVKNVFSYNAIICIRNGERLGKWNLLQVTMGKVVCGL